ncbi:hypothetical protein REPUB_Repub08aG0104900 [Reevesia pubescens]
MALGSEGVAKEDGETREHVFFKCPVSREVLNALGNWTYIWVMEDHDETTVCLHDQVCITPGALLRKAASLSPPTVNGTQYVQAKRIKWIPPPSGSIKLNVDATWNRWTKEATLGVVACDYNGMVLFSAHVKKQYTAPAIVVELISIRHRLELAKDWELQNIILESDCLQAD